MVDMTMFWVLCRWRIVDDLSDVYHWFSCATLCCSHSHCVVNYKLVFSCFSMYDCYYIYLDTNCICLHIINRILHSIIHNKTNISSWLSNLLKILKIVCCMRKCLYGDARAFFPSNALVIHFFVRFYIFSRGQHIIPT